MPSKLIKVAVGLGLLIFGLQSAELITQEQKQDQVTNLGLSSVHSMTLAQLNSSQIQQLKEIGMKVAVPTYIPAGFTVDQVIIEPCPPGGGRFCPQYGITYRNDNNSCFAIEATIGGVGGLPTLGLLNQYPVNNSVLGSSELFEYGSSREFSGPTLIGEWMGTGPFYRFIGVGAKLVGFQPKVELSNCQDISPQEAVKIWESFRYLE